MPAVSVRSRTLMVMRLVLLLLLLKKRKQIRARRRPRRWWVRPVFLARRQEGLYHTAMRRMREGDHGFFFKFYRMTPALFDILLSYVAADLTKFHVSRDPLEPGERLAIALSYLASGQDVPSVALAYRVGIETARLCLHLTCRALWARLKDHVMKGTFSIVLLAVADSECKFVIIDVGAEGRQSDGGTFKNSDFGSALIEGSLGIPALACLPCTSTNVPYVFIGDEAFQLRKDFMRPFPARQLDDSRRIFNYRLSRARRCVENAFGITAARWRILLRTINLLPENVDYVIKAACVLHNFLTVHNPQSHQFPDKEDSFGNIVGGRWRQGMQGVPDNCFFPIQTTTSRNFNGDAAAARDLFTAYFSSSAGQVPWQWRIPGVSKKHP
ncbi:hypothetical protein HPB50_026947 [Hyalomma asiaticum]|uniref:Uncharacterized protein n=1 Tax=Hyalomma asiaticum TaxID=266040 RepID=A0ACB7T4M0_HYAAI|nr:hypothetical protein HPB50_026947 [Hyalomma asiaticum]